MSGRAPSPTAAQWVSALNHPLRRHILRVLSEKEVASAKGIAGITKLRLGNVAYHLKVLTGLDVIELVRRRQVRGAFEKFYRSVPIEGKLDWVGVVLERTRRTDP